ncbi:MAG TPA: M48 family metallopeptidase [Burkholderiales bacterium]|nr:M48 family metallopeptidase [Burkholderiales bacterium]
MDFFENQERARRSSALLVLLYALAVLGIVAAVDLVLHVAYRWNAPQEPVPLGVYVFGAVATLALILSVTLVQVARLSSGGGDAVARMAGARRVSPDAGDALERRLLNVVEEIAIASGVRVPNVYVMDGEEAINAFAAGYDPSHAVVAVTHGALRTLNRDELQGVIAHEFSHILNGDMRLNIRMLGVLAGIVFIGAIGRFMMYGAARARGRNAGGVVFVGIGLLAIGAIGLLFSQIIKAAVSRQREYLADASSVQFTRNPDAIAGALDQIALAKRGTRVGNRYAEEMSHMYFAKSAPSLFATHPPIAERIRRAHPRFDAEAYRRRRAHALPEAPEPSKGEASEDWGRSPQAALALIGALEPGKIDLARRLMLSVPAALHGRIETPEGASAFLIALMLSKDAAAREAQIGGVRAAASPALAGAALELAPQAASLARALRLPAIDLALPALKAASPQARQALVAALEAAIRADRQVSLHELVVLALVRDQLAGAPRSAAGRKSLAELRIPAGVLLSLLSDPAAERPAPEALGSALDALKTLAPRQKELLMKELLAAAHADGAIRIDEAELLRLVAAVLDCPLPPLAEG